MNRGFNKGFVLGIVVAILAVALVGGGFLLGRGSADKDSNKDNKSAQKVTETTVDTANENAKDDAATAETETEKKDSEEFKPNAAEMDTMNGVEFTSIQEWEEEDWHCYNYTVKIHNDTKRKVEEWIFKMEVPEGSELSQYWESKMKLENNEIVVEPVDYNKEIEKDGEVSFGFILKTKVKYNYKKANKDLVL
ncbi:MAG: hypothetical protein E7254_09490 [Lachnospiraceae bacterium]|nr:hypothetical protein [Lachnospiraceae bacterium]